MYIYFAFPVLPCPGPGEDTIDFEDKNDLELTITGPETVENRKPLAFLRGVKGKIKSVFLVKQNDEENEMVMDFKGKTYNIVKLNFETTKADWIQADLYNGNTLQYSAKVSNHMTCHCLWYGKNHSTGINIAAQGQVVIRNN